MRVLAAPQPQAGRLLRALCRPAAADWRRQRRQRHRVETPPRRHWSAAVAGQGGDASIGGAATAEKQAAAHDSSSSSSSDGGGSGGGAAWQEAQQEIQAQQAAGLHEAYPLDKTRQLVETAMFAAVTGLAYTVGNLLRLEGYLAYVLPLPVVLAAMRSGPGGAFKALTTAVLLLLILMGPVRAATYLLVYGVLSLALGLSWAARLPWLLSVPLGAAARIGGYFAYIMLSSWVTNENLLALMVSNVYALLDQLASVLGTTGAPPPLAVAVVLASLLFVNSLLYVFLMHVMYAIMLRSMGLGLTLRIPQFCERFISNIPAT